MKKIFAILLTMVMIATMFIGCSKEESEAVNGTTEPETVAEEAVDAVVDELTEDVSVESTTTDENGNEITIGKDADGNTVEVKTNKDGTVTKTVTDKKTGKKTEQTTTVAPKPVTTTSKSQQTTKKSETTTKKSTPQTTKKTETTTKKPAQTTTKPATTGHTHNFVKKSKQVLVKEAWDEDIYETREIKEYHEDVCACGYDCTQAYRDGKYPKDAGITSSGMLYYYHVETDCPRVKAGQGTYCNAKYVVVGTEKVKVDTIHHDAEYRTETWYECSCGAKK